MAIGLAVTPDINGLASPLTWITPKPILRSR